MSIAKTSFTASKNFERLLLFLSNGITPEDSLEEFRRVPLFNLLLFLGIFCFSGFSFITVLSGNFLFAGIELAMALLFIVGYFISRSRGIAQWASLALLSAFYLFFIVLGITGGPDGNGYLWIYTFPLMSSFLAGPRRGTLWSASLITILLAAVLSFPENQYIAEYHPTRLIRLTASFSIVTLFSFITDGIIIYSFHKMHEMKRKLEITITELHQSREELQQQAIHDGLTGIYNRRFFNQTITTWTIQAKRHNSYTALFMIDVDYFKKYNDCFGHLKGDSVLKSVSVAIQKSLRRESDMVFRYGGEEFVVMLTKTTPKTTRELSEKIMHNIRRCNILHPESPYGVISISMGVVEWDSMEDIVAEEFIERADSALYKAKANGRNRIEFYAPQTEDPMITSNDITEMAKKVQGRESQASRQNA